MDDVLQFLDVELTNNDYDLLRDDWLSSSMTSLNLKGDEIQKLSVVQAIPQLLQTDQQATCTRIIPKILQELPNSSCEFHVMTSKVFRSVMEKQIPVNLLSVVLQCIDSRDLIVASAWLETLLAIIPVLTRSQIKEIIPLAYTKALLIQPLASRIGSCRMIGPLAVHSSLDPLDVKKDILPIAQSLCQDCHSDVRRAMCIQLPLVGQGLGPALMTTNLLTSLVELASDENVFVRSAAITTAVQLFPHTSLEINKSTMLPLIKQLCKKSLTVDDLMTSAMSKEIGHIVIGLQMVLDIPDSIWFLDSYKSLASRGLSNYSTVDASLAVTCRQNCASNLPALSTFTFAVIPDQIEVLYRIFQELAADPCYLVRKMVAQCLHEIIKIFGEQSKMLKADLVRLLRDDSQDVLQTLVPCLGITLELLCRYGTLSRQASSVATMEIGRAMLKCQHELATGYNWRMLTRFIQQLEHLPNCMPPDFIHQHFTPVILSCAVQGRARPVRAQSVRSLLIFLRYNGKEVQRRWLRENMITQLCYSKCSYTRHVFVQVCINALDLFSEKYFKNHFYESLLDLADDPVANIRLCVTGLFATLKCMLILPEDEPLSTRLDAIIQKYKDHEKDRDVLEIYERRMKELKCSKTTLDADEHDREEKRRQDEEEKIARGRSNLLLSAKLFKKPVLQTNPPTKRSSKDAGISKPGSQRSLSMPSKFSSANSSSNDMNFLEQHFYIDTGINLPIRSISDRQMDKNDYTDKLTYGDAKHFESESSNITDDDKVKLRKLTADSEITFKNAQSKRHSSIFSASCVERMQEKKSHKRHSLNITTKETSKIPICSKNSKYVTKGSKDCLQIGSNESVNDDGNNGTVTIKKTSHLPVLKRRSTSEARKPFT